MGRKKKIQQIIETERIDTETGEINITQHAEVRQIPVEENYVKLFCNCCSRLLGLSASESDVFHRIITTMGYNNMVCLAGPFRQIIAKSLNISSKTLEKAIKELREREIIIPIRINGMTKRGWYVVNPNYVAKGAFSQIEALKMYITIEKDGKSYMSLGARYNDGQIIMSEEFPIELPAELSK